MSNFYNTENVKSKGRLGDTTIRTVAGEASHVNAFEAYLIDSYGEEGENIVQDIGSGTINPETGMPEYFLGTIAGILGAGLAIGGGRIIGKNLLGSQGADQTLGSLWDYSFGKHGLGKIGRNLGIGAKQRERERQAGEAVDLGMEGITASAEASFGPQGYFQKTQDLNKSQSIMNQNLFQTTKAATEGKVGMAYSGQSAKFADMQQKQLIDESMMKQTALQKDKTDLALSLRNQVNQLLAGYATATGDPYGDPNELYEQLNLSIGAV